MAENTRAVVYMDRDGTINHDPGYLSNPDEVVLFDGVATAIKHLNDQSIKVIVITNQSAIGRGYFSESALFAVNSRVSEIIKGSGGRLDGIYYCPHTPDAGCGCRKPKIGLIEQAEKEHDLHGLPAYFIGDKVSDMEAARGAGVKAIMVLTGYGEKELEKMAQLPDFVAKDLSVAVDWIISDLEVG